MKRIAALVEQSTGFDLEPRWAHFTRTVDTRRGGRSVDDYLRRLGESPPELKALVEELVVPETWFLRDREPFVLLKQYAAGRPGLRALSIPSSTGEEPYSIAITLLEAGLPAGSFSVDAADISEAALTAARAALYSRYSFRGNSGDFRDRYFTQEGDKFRLRPDIAGLVRFHRDNLLDLQRVADRPFDVVFCRNVLIYFTDEARRQALRQLDRLLAPGGMLFTGHSETMLFLSAGYSPVNHPRAFACTKPAAARLAAGRIPALRPLAVPASAGARPVRPRPAAATPAPAPAPADLLSQARKLADGAAFDEAARTVDLRLAQCPSDPEAYFLKGLIAQAAGDLDAAAESLRKTLYLDPEHQEALMHMSLLCERRGDAARGEIFRRRAARLRPVSERSR